MNELRRKKAKEIRIGAAIAASIRFHPEHKSNGDEKKFIYNNNELTCLTSFTKGLPHNYDTGLVANPADYSQFVKGIESSDPEDFISTPLGPIGYTATNNAALWYSSNSDQKLRAWESQAAGNLFDLEGPDAHSVTMPPCPKLGSAELTAEIGEVYVQALLRDVPFSKIVEAAKAEPSCTTYMISITGDNTKTVPVTDIINELKELAWFNNSKHEAERINEDGQQLTLNKHEKSRLRKILKEDGKKEVGLDAQNLFRGITPGDNIGPYISQFLLVGNTSLNGEEQEGTRSAADGLIAYGAQNIDQRVRIATPCKDYMTTWDAWYDVQQAADLTKTESYSSIQVPKPDSDIIETHSRRFITTPRDLATFVHYDALYQAYLNACLILLTTKGIKLDPGIPYQDDNFIDHQQGFAHFGGPHILSLVTEVATRALKAVRFQKFNIHRRMRPEVLAARLAKQGTSANFNYPELAVMVSKLKLILDRVNANNGDDPQLASGKNYLLPMAFAEGSPMHPSYGAGHATVAGACVTILKAFFDHTAPLDFTGTGQAFVPAENGLKLNAINVVGGPLTVEGELNKLASNIAIGRDWAGVHYFTDYIESLRTGEKIAIGILQEQKLTYNEHFSLTIPLFDGSSLTI